MPVVFLLLLSPIVAAANPAQLSVSVFDEHGSLLKGAAIELAGRTHHTSTGALTFESERARLYQLAITADGYYPSVQTFSDLELQRWSYRIPPIALVRRKPDRVLLAFGGDVMLGRRYHEPNEGEPRYLSPDRLETDTRELLTSIRPYLLGADVASLNLESVVVKEEPAEHAPKSVVFHSPPETIGALEWAGVDYVSLGNNHSYDYLEAALAETIDRLEASTMGFSGAGPNELQALSPWVTNVGGLNLSYHAFVGWPGRVEPSQVAEGTAKGGAALGTEANIRKSLAMGPDDTAQVVQYHGSAEYSFTPTDETRRRAHAAIDAGADLVIGHHPHVLHGMEIYQGKLIAYSLGNFLFDQYIYETQRSALLYVWVDGDDFYRAEIVPLHIKGYRPTPAVGRLRDDVLRRLQEQSRREGTSLGFSGGHAVIGGEQSEQAIEEASPMSQAVGGKVVRFEGWSPLTSPAETCEFGWDWWATGNYEQEGLFGIKDYGWNYSSAESGVTFDEEEGNFYTELHVPQQSSNAVSMVQKYFTRTWNNDPKSVSLKVRSSRAARVQVCLEQRRLDQSTPEGRANPEVRCLSSQTVQPAEEWQHLDFDYEPPPRESLRGIRFRINLSLIDEASAGAGPGIVGVDDLQFISWTENRDDLRINVFRCE